MRPFFILCCFFGAAVVPQAATVTGNILQATGDTKDGQIVFHPTRPIVFQGSYISAADRSVRTVNGAFSIYLVPNDYETTVFGRAADHFTIRVPTQDGTYDWTDLITNNIVYVYLGPHVIGGMTNLTVTGNGINVSGSPVSGSSGSLILTVPERVLTLSGSGIDIAGGPVTNGSGSLGFTVPERVLNLIGSGIDIAGGPVTNGAGSLTFTVPERILSLTGSGIDIAGGPVTNGAGSLTFTLASHTHAASDIISGILAAARILAASTNGQVPFVSGTSFAADPRLWYDATNGVMHLPAISTFSLAVNGTNSPPTTNTDAGLPGEWAWNSSWIYLATGTNNWKRAALHDFNWVDGGGTQTPWSSDINASGFNLMNAGGVTIGTTNIAVELSNKRTSGTPVNAPTVVATNSITTGTNLFVGPDQVKVTSDAPNLLSIRNGTNDMGLNLFGTYTDSANYERAYLQWTGTGSSAAMHIGVDSQGTGSSRPIYFDVAGSSKIAVDTSGNLEPSGNNNVNLGVSGTHQWKSIFLGTSAVAPVFTITGTTNQVIFGATNTAPSSPSAPTKWISVQVSGESTVYRLPLYQ